MCRSGGLAASFIVLPECIGDTLRGPDRTIRLFRPGHVLDHLFTSKRNVDKMYTESYPPEHRVFQSIILYTNHDRPANLQRHASASKYGSAPLQIWQQIYYEAHWNSLVSRLRGACDAQIDLSNSTGDTGHPKNQDNHSEELEDMRKCQGKGFLTMPLST